MKLSRRSSSEAGKVPRSQAASHAARVAILKTRWVTSESRLMAPARGVSRLPFGAWRAELG